MLSKLRPRLSYANVVSTVCLFIVLGGTSYAVATGSIDSREIKNNTVRSKDVHNQSLLAKDFAPGQLPPGPPGPPGPSTGSAGGDLTGTYPNPKVGLVQAGAANQIAGGFQPVIRWDELAQITTTDADADPPTTVRIFNSGSQNILARWPAGIAGLPPGGSTTASVLNPTSFFIWSADGARSWLVDCIPADNDQVRCLGVANRVG